MPKVRVYELAKELGVESKVVMTKLQELGEFVRSASSTVEPPVVRRLRAEMPAAPAEAPAAAPAKKAAPRKSAAAATPSAPPAATAAATAVVDAPAPSVEPAATAHAHGPRAGAGPGRPGRVRPVGRAGSSPRGRHRGGRRRSLR